MKRAALAGLALSILACNSATPTSVAQMLNPTAVALGGRNMLVLDADRAQVRALSLDPAGHKIVRAPNPIYPLAIPTAPFPNALAAATLFQEQPSTSPPTPLAQAVARFAFALSTASSQVTVIDATTLTRLGELQVPDTTVAIAVQPCAALDQGTVVPSQSCVQETTTLALAVVEPAGGAIYLVDFEAGLGTGLKSVSDFEAAVAQKSASLRRVASLGSQSRPAALAFATGAPAALSTSPGDRDHLLVADQSTAGGGSLALVDLVSGDVQRFDVGGPLQAITVDPTGTRAFGLVTRPTCTETPGACAGLVGLQLSAPPKVVPAQGAPLISVSGAARGIAASVYGGSSKADQSEGIAVTITNSSGTTAAVSIFPLVAVTATDGSVNFFDGGLMNEIAAQTDDPTYTASHLDPSGATTDDPNGPSNVTLSKGATLTEVVAVTNGGALPALLAQSGQVDPAAAVLTAAGLDFAARGARVGDRVRFAGLPAGCLADAGGTATIASIAVGQLGLPPGLDLTCVPAPATFEVDAPAPGGASPDTYVVAGSTSGLMGRVHPGDDFVFDGLAFLALAPGPALQFHLGSGDPRDGASYKLTLDSGYTPFLFSMPLNTTTLVLTVPGAIAFDPQTKNLFTVYQGGAALIEIDPRAARTGNNTAGTAVYR